MAASRQKAHENFTDSDESSEEEEDSSDDSEDEINLPYLCELLEEAKRRFIVINEADSSLDLPKLEAKDQQDELAPDGNALLDCSIKGMNWNPHSKDTVGKFMEYQ